MDKSKEFIEMSDCPEIQDSYKDYCGEFSSYFWNELSNLFCSKCGYCGVGKFCENCGSELVLKKSGYINCDDSPSEPKYIWLPRQDQLQDMVNFGGTILIGHTPDGLLMQTTYKNKEIVVRGASMEQLWLAFVMSEKFGKVWKEGKWE